MSHPTLWLCHPGMSDNPCEDGLDATVISPTGARSLEPFAPATDPVADCFYVYPTVSEASGDSAPLEATPAEVRAARAQAARFAASCRLFAPVYRQITRRGLVSGALSDPGARDRAYRDVLDAFNDYLNTENAGRPIVLLGHSQGASTLVRLIQEEVDGNPALRARVLSALLLGASVTTLPGEVDHGTFVNLPACESADQSGCVVSYVTYAGTPPDNGIFGRSTDTRQSLCVSPAQLLGRGVALSAYLPTSELTGNTAVASDAPTTGFVTLRGMVSGRCRHSEAFGWMDLSFDRSIDDRLPALLTDRDPAWGTHVIDVNIALGDLVDLVAAQARAWSQRGGPSQPHAR